MNEVDAVGEIIAVLSGSEPFSGTHPLYSAVEFVPEYPLENLSVPKVAITVVGGTNRPRGIGTYTRIGKPTFQLDVLADTSLEARRIFQRCRQAIMADYENADGTGVIGKGYLKGKYIKSAVLGEPRTAIWDEAGRVQRVTADLVIEYLEEEA
jgi:hypothetical protein